jgi:hypothetical protein
MHAEGWDFALFGVRKSAIHTICERTGERSDVNVDREKSSGDHSSGPLFYPSHLKGA